VHPWVLLLIIAHPSNSFIGKQTEWLLCVVKLYILFFVVISFAETIFTATYFLITQKIDKVILLGLMVYAGAMIIGYIAYKVEKYRQRKKKLLKSLPGN